MKFLSVFVGFLFTEAEQGVLVIIGVSHWHVSESGGKTLKNLLLFLFNQEQLHVATDSIVGSLIDTNQVAPLSSGINSVIHNLTISEFWFLFKDSFWSGGVINIGVINVLFTNNTKSVISDPSPESDWLIDFTLLHFSFGG